MLPPAIGPPLRKNETAGEALEPLPPAYVEPTAKPATTGQSYRPVSRDATVLRHHRRGDGTGGAGIAPNGAVAVGFGDRPPRAAKRKPSIRIGRFRKVVRGGLRGYCNVTWLAGGQHLRDCGIFVGPNGPFVSLPSAPVVGADGRQVVIDGRRQYQQLVLWRSRERRAAFSAAVLEALLKKYPDALEHEPAEEAAE